VPLPLLPTYNEGCCSLETSTLASRLLHWDDMNTVAEEEFPRWVYGGSPPRVLLVLVNRQKDEIKLFGLSSDVQLTAMVEYC
jgi:GH24 family phage-related lysozyme (muramidase)